MCTYINNMIHYVYIDGKIYYQEVGLFDFGSKFFRKGQFYRVKSEYEPFNWQKYTLYVDSSTRVNEDTYEITFRDPIFRNDSVFILVRGYVNYHYDDYEENEEDNKDINVEDFKEDMSPVGWYVKTKNNEYIAIELNEKV